MNSFGVMSTLAPHSIVCQSHLPLEDAKMKPHWGLVERVDRIPEVLNGDGASRVHVSNVKRLPHLVGVESYALHEHLAFGVLQTEASLASGSESAKMHIRWDSEG